ncbi:MAG: FtsX-like permease family protein [Methanoregulaceae archaeon]|jgi:putative ABC transport system permease protein|nr:FtsX-like permease family protein [Methanoregulaceae archaeon]MCU0628598.1 FtsX-like permease family protein [Methanoregulaceae archaeon]
MFEDSKVAFFLAKRSIARGNKGTLYLTILIIGMVFVNLIFLPSIISGVAVLFNQQTIDYSYGNLVIEPKKNQVYINNADELQRKIERIPGVTGVSPRYLTGATIVYKGNEVTPLLYAINPDDDRRVLKIASKVASGEYLGDGDTDQIVIGFRLAGNDDEKLDVIPSLGGVDVGKVVDVTFNNGVTRQYRIKGIINSDSYDVDSNAFITKNEYESVFGLEDKANQMLVRTQETGNEDMMRNTLMAFGVQEKIWTWEEKSANFLNQIIGSFNIINFIGTIVSLVIAIVVIFIVIFINTVYRRKQIGILKAIGIDRSVIIKSYLFQALFIFAIGTIIGCGFLVLILQLLAANPIVFPGGPVAPVVDAMLILRSTMSLLAVSLIAGYIPAWITTREDILTAIRG